MEEDDKTSNCLIQLEKIFPKEVFVYNLEKKKKELKELFKACPPKEWKKELTLKAVLFSLKMVIERKEKHLAKIKEYLEVREKRNKTLTNGLVLKKFFQHTLNFSSYLLHNLNILNDFHLNHTDPFSQ